jgi:hypothetical protein
MNPKSISAIVAALLFTLNAGCVSSPRDDQPSNAANTPASTAAAKPLGTVPGTNPVAREPVVSVTAEQLFGDYDADAAAADLKYKDKELQITGRVDGIGEVTGGDTSVVLANGTPSSDTAVECHFDANSMSTVVKLTRGQEITARCVCEGKSGDIMLGNCVLQ